MWTSCDYKSPRKLIRSTLIIVMRERERERERETETGNGTIEIKKGEGLFEHLTHSNHAVEIRYSRTFNSFRSCSGNSILNFCLFNSFNWLNPLLVLLVPLVLKLTKNRYHKPVATCWYKKNHVLFEYKGNTKAVCFNICLNLNSFPKVKFY